MDNVPSTVEKRGPEYCSPLKVSEDYEQLVDNVRREDGQSRRQLAREILEKVVNIVNEGRVSKQAKANIEGELGKLVDLIQECEDERSIESARSQKLLNRIAASLTERGIESEGGWQEYLATMEKDGELVTNLCDLLKVDVFQLQEAVVNLKRKVDEGGSAAGKRSQVTGVVTDNITNTDMLQASPLVCGPTSASNSNERPASVMTTPAREESGENLHMQLVNYLRAMTCSDPGVFRGTPKENFSEFLRKFKRKYESVIACEATLVDILGDDHLGGRARNIFASLPRATKEQGFHAVTTEMARLLACDSTVKRMRALTELKNLKLRPSQDLAAFCVELERLGREANPQSCLEDRSLEFAHILLENVRHWPEHFQLVAALHNVDPKDAYERVKQLALSIEQSKLMLVVDGKPAWRTRFARYQEEERKKALVQAQDSRTARYDANEGGAVSGNTRGPGLGVVSSLPPLKRQEHQVTERGITPGGRKCYKCSRHGHIARDCPQRVSRVNRITQQLETEEAESLSEIIRKARCSEVSAQADVDEELLGARVVTQVSLLGESVPALVDTGSMISIVPVEILALAQDRGYDIDSLRTVSKSKLAPVYDASNNRMELLGAVYMNATVEGGDSNVVAFHIAPGKAKELLLGTNALAKLGVCVSIARKGEEPKQLLGTPSLDSKVVVLGRRYIPPGEVAWVQVRCQGVPENTVDKVIWPGRASMVAGVYRIQDGETTVPVVNNNMEAMILKEGEEVGHWSTDKWQQQWDGNPLVWEDKEIPLSEAQRISNSSTTSAARADKEKISAVEVAMFLSAGE
ncbi:unnamed protein product [Nippostrongylus brasiliensis]|uniref:CCHC-type domain-containing protein n=1 Tax=Nippostrongylus brasiliensis TaxID=27835 RepID=A0A0N4YQR3_NIPBR|nr:unnamed protein product [Nippostrongylus brasiliensis]